MTSKRLNEFKVKKIHPFSVQNAERVLFCLIFLFCVTFSIKALLTKIKTDMNFKQLISLEWKAFKRAGNLLQTILMGVGKAYFGACYFIIMVAFSFAIFKDRKRTRLNSIN